MKLPELHQSACVGGLFGALENTGLKNAEWNKDGFQGYHLGRLVIFHVNDVVSALSIPNSRRLHRTGILFYNQLATVDTKKTVALRQLVMRHRVQKPKVASNLCTWKRKQSNAKSSLVRPLDTWVKQNTFTGTCCNEMSSGTSASNFPTALRKEIFQP